MGSPKKFIMLMTCAKGSQILTLVTMIPIILVTQLTNHYSPATNGQNISFC